MSNVADTEPVPQSSTTGGAKKRTLADVLSSNSRTKPLSQTHPVYALERLDKKAYLSMVLYQLSDVLDDVAFRKASVPVVDLLGVSLDRSYWEMREVFRNKNAAQAGKLTEEEQAAVQSAFIKFRRSQDGKKNDAELLKNVSSNRWVTFNRHKAFLFLDTGIVLMAAGRHLLEQHFEAISEGLKIPDGVSAIVRGYLEGEQSPDRYKEVCAAIDAIVKKPESKNAKSASKTKKPAAKKDPQPA